MKEIIQKSKFKIQNSKSGFTLLESVVYISFLGIISVLIVNFMAQISSTYHALRAEREVVSNARLLMERVGEIIAQSREVYSPTSRFNNNSGQLSLVTANLDPNHQVSFTDLWVDNGRLWAKEEGRTALPISASSVRVDSFYLERIVQKATREAVKVTLKAGYASPINLSVASTTLNATVALRGNY